MSQLLSYNSLDRWIPGIEYHLMPLHIKMHTMTRNLRDKHMPPREVEIIRHVSTVDILNMQRKFGIRRETI
jgi:hypothetical protein